MIENYQKTTGSTVIVVSHSMEDIASIADRILVMNKAQVAFWGTVQEVFSHAAQLVDMGLDIPQMTRLCLALRAKGFDVPTDVYTVEQAHEAILKCLRKEGAQ